MRPPFTDPHSNCYISDIYDYYQRLDGNYLVAKFTWGGSLWLYEWRWSGSGYTGSASFITYLKTADWYAIKSRHYLEYLIGAKT